MITKMINPETYAKVNTEHAHQTALFMWAADPEVRKLHPELKWLFAVPNGGFRDKITASRLKAEGVKAGVPDIWFPVKRGMYSGLVIELKKLPAKSTHKRIEASEKQGEWIDFLRSQNYGAAVCMGWKEATIIILSYLDYENEKEAKRI